MCLLGCDIGSSSVKASIVDKDTGLTLASDFYPKEEAAIKAVRPGWAEQNPDDWWMYLKEVDRRKAMPGTSFEFSRKLYGFQIGMGKRV